MQWNTGRSYKLDRARHNKQENYEVPINKRKRRFKKGGEIDDKKAMVLSQIKEVHHHADELAKVLANMDTVDAWVVGKMERATTDLSDITHYLDGTTEYAKGGIVSDNDILDALSGFNNGLTLTSISEVIGLSNYRFGKYATESQMKNLQRKINNLIKNGYVKEGGVGYMLTKKGNQFRYYYLVT
jgi:predicted transcriptional regulator